MNMDSKNKWSMPHLYSHAAGVGQREEAMPKKNLVT